jgi:hypothetical protein
MSWMHDFQPLLSDGSEWFGIGSQGTYFTKGSEIMLN